MEIFITKKMARRFVLLKQGLLGKYRFAGRDGAVSFLGQMDEYPLMCPDIRREDWENILTARVRGMKRKIFDSLSLSDMPDRTFFPSSRTEAMERFRCRVLCRAGTAGLFRDGSPGLWSGIDGLEDGMRGALLEELMAANQIVRLNVEDVEEALYCRAQDMGLFEQIREGVRLQKRCELISPADMLMWDREILKALFGFEEQRQKNTVLYILYGECFVGKLETDGTDPNGQRCIKNMQFDPEIRTGKTMESAVAGARRRFERF